MSPTKQLIRRRFADDCITPSSSEDNGMDNGMMCEDISVHNNSYDHVSLQDQAALLLSVASIARSEFTSRPHLVDSTNSLIYSLAQADPSSSITDKCFLTPRVDLRPTLQPSTHDTTIGICTPSPSRLDFNRARTVSIDSPLPSVPSITEMTTSDSHVVEGHLERLMAPFTSKGCFIRPEFPDSVRNRVISDEVVATEAETGLATSPTVTSLASPKGPTKATSTVRSNKKLQGEPPKGTRIKKIVRRKFSWKNYPELEQFLIANREEYLRFSALNYTLQQKQYNNKLTERLLDLATEHGYIFGSEFGFVTVRDRIRCYYKSFVQSAKKRGILMGYAARKAGLINIEDEIVAEDN